MKKTIAFLLTILLLFCSGCIRMTDDLSSVTYLDGLGNTAHSDIASTDETPSELENIEPDNVSSVISWVPDNISGEPTDNGASEITKEPTVIVDENANVSAVEKIPAADIDTTGEKPLYYTSLTPSQQQIYSYMKTAAEQMKEGLFFVGAVTQTEDRFSDIAVAFRAFSSDNPQIFWLPNSYVISSDGSAMAFSYEEKGKNYIFTQEQKEQAELQLNSAVNSLVSQASQLNSRFEKELFFHDWICENVQYKTDDTDNVYTAYGALVNGVAVCEGYSRAMQLLCDAIGIPCTVVYGSSQGQGHMWNIIDAGDGWCHLDVTWDDDEKYRTTRHAYVNLTDVQILQDHTISEVVKKDKSYTGMDDFNIFIYDCVSEKYNYFVKNDLVVNDDLNAAAKTVINVSESQNSVELLYVGSNENYTSYLNQLNRAIYENGSGIWIKNYSYVSNALMLWW